MATHKLSQGPLVISVVRTEIVEGKFGSQVKFVGIDCSSGYEVDLYVNEDTALRQLERLGFDAQTAVDNAFHVEQVQKDSRTYTNFRRATDAEVNGGARPSAPAAPAAAGVPGPGPRPAAPSVDVAHMYRTTLQEAVECADFLAEAGYPCDATNVIAVAATLFIQKNKR
jgi:hypothetical protein